MEGIFLDKMLGRGRFFCAEKYILFKGDIMKKLMVGLAALAVLGFFTGCDNMGGVSEPETSGGNKTEQRADSLTAKAIPGRIIPAKMTEHPAAAAHPAIRPKLWTYLQ